MEYKLIHKWWIGTSILRYRIEYSKEIEGPSGQRQERPGVFQRQKEDQNGWLQKTEKGVKGNDIKDLAEEWFSKCGVSWKLYRNANFQAPLHNYSVRNWHFVQKSVLTSPPGMLMPIKIRGFLKKPMILNPGCLLESSRGPPDLLILSLTQVHVNMDLWS